MHLLIIILCNILLSAYIRLLYHAWSAELLICLLGLCVVCAVCFRHIRGRMGAALAGLAFFIFWASGIVSLSFYNDFFAVDITDLRPERLGLLSRYLRDLPFIGLAATAALTYVQFCVLRSSNKREQGNNFRGFLAFLVLVATLSVSQLPALVTFAQDHSGFLGAKAQSGSLYEPSDSIAPENSIDEPVDIYVIQSEAFFDIRRLGIKLTANPYIHFDALKSEAMWGELGVPVQGGITSNSEFEFLTGVRASEVSSVPFDDFIKAPIPSLASKAKAAGFSTTGIHPHTPDFYRRSTVYPLLGFDRFLSINDFTSPEKAGAWVRDTVGYTRALQEAGSNPHGSNLIFYVTVQNHGPYLIKWKNPIYPAGLSREDTWSIRNLAGGHRESDKALAGFIDTLRKSPKRSIVVLYGDHQPAAGHDFYGQLPYFKTKSNAFRTEYLIWDSAQKLSKGKADTNILSLGATVRSLIPGNVSLNDRFLLAQYKDAAQYLEKADSGKEAAVSKVAGAVRRKDMEAMDSYIK